MNSLAQYLFSLYFSRCHQDIYYQNIYGDTKYEYYENSINNSIINNVKKCYETINMNKVTINSNDMFCSFYFTYLLQRDVTNIILEYSNDIYLTQFAGELSSGLSNPKKLNIVIFGDNNTIYYDYNNRLVPLPIKKVISFINHFPFEFTFGKELLNYIFSFYRNINPFVNDIENTIKQDKFFILPLTFNELLQYYSKKDFFVNKYKISSSININWNKRDMNVSYLIIKSWNMVVPEHRNKLLQIKNLPTSYNIYSFSVSSSCKNFLKGYILDNIADEDEDIGILVNDYVNMCRIAKEKIRINFHSAKALREEHDRLSEKRYMKDTPLVKIKKDTRFKELRKILPDEFEWIKSRKRLIKETVMQHHCVWSYANKINKDTCQIYSYVNESGERFTLEFRISRNKYILAQIQGKYNQGDTSIVSKYVRDILTNYQVYQIVKGNTNERKTS